MMNLQRQASSDERTAARPSALIGYKTALATIVVFGMLIVIPPCHQFWVEMTRMSRWRFLDLFQERPTHASLKRFGEALATDSVLAARARQSYRAFLMRWFHHGNEKIVVGQNDFLFLQKEVEMAAGPGFLRRPSAAVRGIDERSTRANSSDILGAIVDFKNQLRALGIHLVFVPIPAKAFIYPEEVWPGYPATAGPAWNRDRAAFIDRLAEAGVDVVDVTNELWRAKALPGERLFLRLDTHWTPRGLSVVADRLAAHVRPRLARTVKHAFTTRAERVSNFGDLLRILELEPASGLFKPQTVEIIQVLDGGALARGDDSAPVLLLGDSFANIYRRKEMEWGDGAGLGEHLMLRLGAGVQVIAINGGGATPVRERLAQNPAALRHKKVVVWACSARDLYDEAVVWERVPIPAADSGLLPVVNANPR
jgi:alginate O-acetyltransferase complex protein AlgJ